jgi:hypothetical protein
MLAALGFSPDAKVGRDGEEIDQRNEQTVLLMGHWQYIGRGHSPGEAIFARTTAGDLAENRRVCRRISQDDDLAGGRP